jgi:hypothetical protein
MQIEIIYPPTTPGENLVSTIWNVPPNPDYTPFGWMTPELVYHALKEKGLGEHLNIRPARVGDVFFWMGWYRVVCTDGWLMFHNQEVAQKYIHTDLPYHLRVTLTKQDLRNRYHNYVTDKPLSPIRQQVADVTIRVPSWKQDEQKKEPPKDDWRSRIGKVNPFPT